MFERIADTDERGQVGIGTLIVFIAMVLVAAIAAGVLINTAGVLQTQASDTGSDTQESVANQIEVTHAVGNITPSEDHIDRVNLTIKQSAGSNAIDINSMTLQYTSDRTDQTLTYRPSATTYGDEIGAENLDSADGSTFEHFEGEYSDGFTVIGADTEMGLYAADSSHFTTTGINNGNDHLTDTGDRITLTMNTTMIENPEDLSEGLSSGDSATLTLTDQSGAQFTYGVSVPSTFGDKTVVKV